MRILNFKDPLLMPNSTKKPTLTLLLISFLFAGCASLDSAQQCNDKGYESSIEETLSACREAALKGDTDAQLIIGDIYLSGDAGGVNQDAEEAIIWYEMAAKQGVMEAKYKLGIMYKDGIGIAKHLLLAHVQFVTAALQGHAEAQFTLGKMHANGEGTPKNDIQAFRWYSMAAKQGYAEAQVCLASIYILGKSVHKDNKQALHWFTLAAEQGHPKGQLGVGEMNHYGKGGVPKSTGRAILWYTLSAKQGDTEAQFRLGNMHLTGDGSPKDAKLAFHWYTLAAKKGHATAQYNLGVLYAYGTGVTKDHKEAYAWLGSAGIRNRIDQFTHTSPTTENINKMITKLKKSLAEDMTPNEIKQAEKLAFTYLRKYKPGG